MRLTTMAIRTLPVMAVMALPVTRAWYELGKETPGGATQFGWHYRFAASDGGAADFVQLSDPAQPNDSSRPGVSDPASCAPACVTIDQLTCLSTDIEGGFAATGRAADLQEYPDNIPRNFSLSLAEGLPFGPAMPGDMILTAANSNPLPLVPGHRSAHKLQGQAARLLCPGPLSWQEAALPPVAEASYAA